MNEFHLVSPLPSKKLSDLSDSALNSNGNPTDFYKYQIETSQQRKKDIADLCSYLDIDSTKKDGLNDILLFLQRFRVIPYVINKHSANELEDKAAALFSGEPNKLLSFLKNYPVESNRLRTKITATLLLDDLKSNGFQPRIQPDDNRISPVIERISNEFSESIEPFLISKSLINRPEVKDVINALDEHTVILIKSEAGMGKSALSFDLHKQIQSNGAISVPIRLDRNRPDNNADSFGCKLGFPYSPILSLRQFAANQKIVIVLDQLDAIRWTGAHSNNALQVCQELVRQVLSLREDGVDITVILACRNFDLDEDVALNSWIKSLDKVFTISLSFLNTETVADLISPYEQFNSISSEKQKILTIPLWLSIYLLIANRDKAAPQFSNKLELVKKFWDDRFNKITDLGISEISAKQLVDEVVVLMNSKSRLSVPESALEICSANTLEALISTGVLTKQSRQISFRHQALFDYQVGKRLFNAALKSPKHLIDELGNESQQTLTKREHLKYALNMALEYGQSEFCNVSLAVLNSDKIRFHLKYLVFNSLKEITDLKSSARSMVETIVQDSSLLPIFMSTSCYNNHSIVSYLSKSSVINAWLNSENETLINKTGRLLSSVAEEVPDIVIKELTSFVGISEIWNNRVYNSLCWNMENDSDSMFELRKQLINLGCTPQFIDWKLLAKKNPSRALDLIEMMLNHYKNSLCAPKYSNDHKMGKFAHRDTWSETELDELNSIATLIPKEALSRLIAIIDDFVGEQVDNNITYNWLYKDKHSSYGAVTNLTKGVFSIVDNCGEHLSKNHPDTLLELIQPYLAKNSPVITYLIAKLLNNLPTEHSNIVIQWLLNSPKSRFNCGNTYLEPEWILPGKLIEKFSAYCSAELLHQLEKTIYFFWPERDIENIKWRLEARRKGTYYSFWGEAQHFLLPKLPQSKINNKTKQLIPVLKRKFKTYTDANFCSAYTQSGGMVTSPLPLPNVLSDNAWIKLILAPKERVNNGSWIQRDADIVAESSIQQFSRSLDHAVKNQPTRFAKLALILPATIDKKYINGFYDGLAEIDSSRVNEEYKDGWALCPPELTEKVINHFKNEDCTSSLVRLLAKRIKEKGWSDKSIKMLIDIAENATDPEPDKLNIRSMEKSEFAHNSDTGTLMSNAINCNRGIAFNGVSHLFWDNEERATELQYLIQTAIDDPHPAVNIVALDMLLPWLNYDQDFALKTFIALCNKDLRMAFGHGAHYFFNHGFDEQYQSNFVNLVLRMLDSPFEDIQKEAARQVFARWFFNDLFQGQIDKVLQGDDKHREGVASVMAQFLQENKYQDHFYKLPSKYALLVNDNSQEVLRAVGRCVDNENFWNSVISTEIFNVFVNSKAALLCLYELFNALEKHGGSLLDYQTQLLQLVNNLTSSDSSKNEMQNVHIRESSLIKILQRLYDEATDDENNDAVNTCLDIWDKLLRSEVYSAINASKELEGGLLS
jgi:hypothetical protein